MKIWIFHPNRAAGGINRVSDSVLKNSALAGESTFSEFGVARRFPGYGFSCISSLFPFLSRFLGKDFLCCVQVLGLQFPKGLSRLHFFPSARFQRVSFSEVPARFLQ